MISHKHLNEICSIKTGKRDANHSVLDGQYPFFTCADKPIKSPTYSFDGDSIILPGNGANVGLVLYYSGKFEAYQRTYVLSEFKNCNPRYVFHHLRCFWTIANQFMQFGSATNYIRMGNFETYKIPIPPIAEQKRIAVILDRTQSLISKRKEAIAKLDTLTQSIFIEMFGNPAINPKGWIVSKLANIAEKITDGEHQTPQRTLQGIKLLSARNIQNGYIDVRDVDYIGIEEYERIKKRCNPERGDVLISCSGTIGRVATVETDEPFSLVRSVAILKLKHDLINSKFLEYFLRTPALNSKMKQRANASSQANLFQNQIRELPALLPPLPLQKEFAQRIEAVEKLKATHRASLSQLEALFASLQHRAFRGEL